MSDLLNVTTTGEVAGVAESCWLHSVTLTPAAAKATLVVRSGGASGTTRITLQAPADGESVTWTSSGPGGVLLAGCHATIAGSGAAASFELSGI